MLIHNTYVHKLHEAICLGQSQLPSSRTKYAGGKTNDPSKVPVCIDCTAFAAVSWTTQLDSSIVTAFLPTRCSPGDISTYLSEIPAIRFTTHVDPVLLKGVFFFSIHSFIEFVDMGSTIREVRNETQTHAEMASNETLQADKAFWCFVRLHHLGVM